jgi:hypothetical protein
MATEKNKNVNLLEYFDDITLSMISSDADEAKAFLQECGLNSDEEIQYGIKQVQKLQFLAKAQLNMKKDSELLEKAFNVLKISIQENTQKAGHVLMDLLTSKRASLQYRNLEKWTDTEIRDVLNDIDLIDLLEKLEKE